MGRRSRVWVAASAPGFVIVLDFAIIDVLESDKETSVVLEKVKAVAMTIQQEVAEVQRQVII